MKSLLAGLFAVCGCLGAPSVSAQESVEPTWSLRAGLGTGTREMAGVLGANVTFGAASARLIDGIEVRGTATTEVFAAEEFWDLGVLATHGRTLAGGENVGTVKLTLGAGLGVAGMRWDDVYLDFCWATCSGHSGGGPMGPDRSWRSLAVPLSAEVAWHPLRFLGLGLYGYANVNPEKPFGGLVLSVTPGRLR